MYDANVYQVLALSGAPEQLPVAACNPTAQYGRLLDGYMDR